MPYKDSAKRAEYRRAYQRNWAAERRQRWFEGKTCAGCGSAEALELDHEDPEKKFSHKTWSWSASRRNLELAKCVARCEACHRHKTNAENKRRQLPPTRLDRNLG